MSHGKFIRDGDKATTFEAKAKDSQSVSLEDPRSQGRVLEDSISEIYCRHLAYNS